MKKVYFVPRETRHLHVKYHYQMACYVPALRG